jgi:hypothetical protein
MDIQLSVNFANDFSEGLAAVSGADEWSSCIKKSGKYAIQPRFFAAREYFDGVANVNLDFEPGKSIDQSENILFNEPFSHLIKFKDSLALIKYLKMDSVVDKTGMVFHFSCLE